MCWTLQPCTFRFYQIFVALPKGYAVALPRAYMQLVAWTEVFALHHPFKRMSLADLQASEPLTLPYARPSWIDVCSSET